MSSAQIGKTELLNNVVGYYMAYDPAPILVLQPTLEMAQTWSKDRLSPMLRDTPCLKEKVSKASAKTSGNTMLHKTFPGGHVTMAGANSPASLASRPIRIVLADEIDRYPPSAGTEGDPLSLARKRTTTFWNRKIIGTSTPTIKGVSRIEDEYEHSDQRKYHVPCPQCGEKQHFEWKNVVFNKNDDGSLDEGVRVTYACVNGCVIDESDKLWMLKHGEWIAQKPHNGHAGFHINEIYSPWVRWKDIVLNFLEAKKSPETLKTWVNTSLGETWEEKGETLDHTGLFERRESYDEDSLPDEIAVVTASVDVQGDRLEALSQGWGVEKERWNIEHRIFWGDPSKTQVWDELDDWLLKTYQVGQRKLHKACTTIDSGGHHTDEVYRFCKKRQGRRVFAIKGSSNYYDPIVSKPTQAGIHRVFLYRIGTDTAKDAIIFGSLKQDHGANYIHFPHTCDEEFFKQLVGEERKTEISRGVKKLVWRKIRERQEILDLHVYNLAAYAILNPDISAILGRRAPKAQEKEPDPTPTTRKRRPFRGRRNWATDI